MASQRCTNTILSLLLLIFGVISASYLTTSTLDFGGQFGRLEKLYNTHLVQSTGLREFTIEELALYDGSDPRKPVYLSVKGMVYDVTNGRKFYGVGGTYASFSGKDASRAFITGCFVTHLTHDLRGLTATELEGLQSWINLYSKSTKYFLVGKMNFPEFAIGSQPPPPCNNNE